MANFVGLKNYLSEKLQQDYFGLLQSSGFLTGSKIRTSGTVYSNPIFLLEKPESVESENYIVIKYTMLENKATKRFVVEIVTCNKSLSNVKSFCDAIINILNFYNMPCPISTIAKLWFSNEGGIFYNDDLGLYTNSIFFDCRILE